MRITLLLGSFLVLSAGIGCGRDDAYVGGSYQGTMSGTLAGEAFATAVTFNIGIGGEPFNGQFTTDSGDRGLFYGGTTRSRLDFVIEYSGSRPGSFGGTGTASDSSINGSFTGARCRQSLNAQFDAQK